MLLDIEVEPSSTRAGANAVPHPKKAQAMPRATERGAARVECEPRSGFALERRLDGKLWLVRDGSSVPVEVVRCFPWTEPTRFLSLRDKDGKEHAFVNDLDELDMESRNALGPGLSRSGFVLDIVRVEQVEEDVELRSFVVETLQGGRRFQTPLDSWPRRLENGALVLEDVYGDLYRIAEPEKLDERSFALMRSFID